MKIILVGGGKVGSALCRSLVADNHDVVLIEQNETVLKYLTSRFDIMGIAGNGADFAMLEAANVQDCDIFIAMTQIRRGQYGFGCFSQKNGSKGNHCSCTKS